MHSTINVFSYSSANLGDEYQSLGVEHALGTACGRLPRDMMGSTDEHKALVVHGWLMQPASGEDYAFPPRASNVLPLSVHLQPGFREWITRTPKAREWFKGRRVGCRDEGTLRFLKSIGAEPWLSGCASLCIKPRQRKRSGSPVLVDLHPSTMDSLPRWARCHKALAPLPEPLVETTHRLLPKRLGVVRRSASQWILSKAPHEKRQARAEALLDLYASAPLVVTRRLHVALPCVALKTPVVLVAWSGIPDHERERLAAASMVTRIVEEHELPSLKAPPPVDEDALSSIQHNIKLELRNFEASLAVPR